MNNDYFNNKSNCYGNYCYVICNVTKYFDKFLNIYALEEWGIIYD